MTEEKIALMFDLAEKQQHAVDVLINELRNTPKNIQKETKEVIRAQVKDSISSLSGNAKTALNQSVEPFKKQMQEVESKTSQINEKMATVADRLSMKVIALVGFACVMCVFATLGASYWLAQDVAALKEEQQRLQANIKALENAGGKVVLGNCDGEVCVRVDPTKKPYTNKATGLPMYFVK